MQLLVYLHAFLFLQVVIEELLREYLPKKRQILLFSATFPVTVKDFRDRYVPEPYEVCHMSCRLVFSFAPAYALYSLRTDQSHGRTHPQGYHAVLRFRGGEAKNPLPQHSIFKAGHKPVDHFLQQRQSR